MCSIDPPVAAEFIKEAFWALHEAAFMLIDTWPEVSLNSFSALPKNLARKFLYVPPTYDCLSSQSKAYDKKFSLLLSEMITAIQQGILPAIFAPAWTNITYFVTPQDIIHWALIHKKILPDQLQLALRFKQMTPKKQISPYFKKIRTKIIAQIILNGKLHLKDNIEAMLEDPLMKGLGTHLISPIALEGEKISKRDKRSIRNDINTLFDCAGKPGRRKQGITHNRLYKPIAIPEVVQIDVKGIPSYHFPLFIEAILLITRVNLYNSPRQMNMPTDQLLKEIKDDSIMKLYLYKSPHVVKKLVDRLIMNEIISLQSTLSISDLIGNLCQ